MSVRAASGFDGNADAELIQRPLKDGAFHVFHAEIQNMGNRILGAVDDNIGVGGKRAAQSAIMLFDNAYPFGIMRKREPQSDLQRRTERKRRRAAPVGCDARTALNQRIQLDIPAPDEKSAAAQSVEFVRRKAHGIDAVQDKLGFPDRLRGVHMEPARGIIL